MMDAAYRLAEAQSFAAHHPGTRVEVVGDVAMTVIGAELTPEQLAWMAGRATADAAPVDELDRYGFAA